jgi:hypothetical protein
VYAKFKLDQTCKNELDMVETSKHNCLHGELLILSTLAVIRYLYVRPPSRGQAEFVFQAATDSTLCTMPVRMTRFLDNFMAQTRTGNGRPRTLWYRRSLSAWAAARGHQYLNLKLDPDLSLQSLESSTMDRRLCRCRRRRRCRVGWDRPG